MAVVNDLRRLLQGSNPKRLAPVETLTMAATIYLNFISLNRRDITQEYIQNAVTRYLKFRRLHYKFPEMVPTRDISLVWVADMLSPSRYFDNDVHWYRHQHFRFVQSSNVIKWTHPLGRYKLSVASALLGTAGMAAGSKQAGLLLVFGALGIWYEHSSSPQVPAILASFIPTSTAKLSQSLREEILQPWLKNYQASRNTWQKQTGTSYLVRPDEIPQKVDLSDKDDITYAQRLEAAVTGQLAFNNRILALGPTVITPTYLATAGDRYMKFLALMEHYPNEIVVPTLDIDLMWHTHMLSPNDYKLDCQHLLGRVLTHSTDHSQNTLDQAFERTKERWEKLYKKPYVHVPKSKDSGGSSCSGSSCGSVYGSSGIEDAIWHLLLHRSKVELSGLSKAYWANDSQAPLALAFEDSDALLEPGIGEGSVMASGPDLPVASHTSSPANETSLMTDLFGDGVEMDTSTGVTWGIVSDGGSGGRSSGDSRGSIGGGSGGSSGGSGESGGGGGGSDSGESSDGDSGCGSDCGGD